MPLLPDSNIRKDTNSWQQFKFEYENNFVFIFYVFVLVYPHSLFVGFDVELVLYLEIGGFWDRHWPYFLSKIDFFVLSIDREKG